MPFILIRADLTQFTADAIVNTANTGLLRGDGGLSGAVFAAADGNKLAAACARVAPCPLGGAVITDSYGLPAQKIIHTAVPVWIDGQHNEEELLRSCYRSVFRVALDNGIDSLAFPLIGGGSHGFSKQLALKAAIEESQGFLLAVDTDMALYLSLFGQRAFGLSQRLTNDIREYINDRYIDERPGRRRRLTALDTEPMNTYANVPAPGGIGRGWLFTDAVLAIIDSRGRKDSQVYKKAFFTKQTFHKLKMHQMNPYRETAVNLCLALELPLPETQEFLAHAGFVLSHSSRADLAIECCIKNRIYNVVKVRCAVSDTLIKDGK